MVGSRITELLKDKYAFDDLSITNGTDITNPESLDVIKNDREHKVVILLAAKADVDGCEQDRGLGEQGTAWKINVIGTQNVVNACLESQKKLIYISTDFVFDGSSTPENGYEETDKPNPVNWYAETKYRGEEIVRNSNLPYIISRIAYPYRKDFELKKDFVRAIIDRLKNNLPIAAISDHKMTPTFIDDIAFALDKLIEADHTGIFHVTGSQSLTPYSAALLIADQFGFDKKLITQTTRAEYFKDKAQRPFNVSMNNSKLINLGVEMKRFEDGLKELN